MDTVKMEVTENTGTTSQEIDPSLSEDERRFYTKAYPSIDLVRDRKVHCTVCKIHIGTAPSQESNIKMHPILRVTHCNKCHDFYNSGEFSKGEDGSELYCRWCGQGGEVYCCSNCPYVFCKSCIVKNLSRGVVADIEQNENWSCFKCAPKILWPLRAQHWALINYIDKQKKSIQSMDLNETELKQQMSNDRSTCCRLAKAKAGNMSDSLESIDSVTSKRSQGSSGSAKRVHKMPFNQTASITPKRAKTSNDEVVCTPDLMSMLEPDCQITVTQKTRPLQSPAASSPKILSIQTGYSPVNTSKGSAPPPLVLRNTGTQMRPVLQTPILRRTITGTHTVNSSGATTPVYHTINGYKIDLNSAAQQETFRLPNGKLIQVKRQGSTQNQSSQPSTSLNWQRTVTQQQQPQMQPARPVNIQTTGQFQNNSAQLTATSVSPSASQHMPQQHPQMVRYHNTMVGNTNVTPISTTQIQVINGTPVTLSQNPNPAAAPRPIMRKHVFPETAIGQARAQLQEQVFSAVEISQHLTGKAQTLTNSNAYKQARNYLEIKELYIHLSYLLTYVIGRYKGLQDKCLADMRQLGFVTDADSLENGQLAADKQASDDEDNEIEIVEQHTDTITLDSDNEDTEVLKEASSTIAVASSTSATTIDEVELMAAAKTFLANMFEVDLNEGSPRGGSTDSTLKKQPRKKTTNKPNPTLLKQKEMLQREKLEEMKRTDHKLKLQCIIKLKRAEVEYPFTKELLNNSQTKTEDDLSKEHKADNVKTLKTLAGDIVHAEGNFTSSLEMQIKRIESEAIDNQPVKITINTCIKDTEDTSLHEDAAVTEAIKILAEKDDETNIKYLETNNDKSVEKAENIPKDLEISPENGINSKADKVKIVDDIAQKITADIVAEVQVNSTEMDVDSQTCNLSTDAELPIEITDDMDDLENSRGIKENNEAVNGKTKTTDEKILEKSAIEIVVKAAEDVGCNNVIIEASSQASDGKDQSKMDVDVMVIASKEINENETTTLEPVVLLDLEMNDKVIDKETEETTVSSDLTEKEHRTPVSEKVEPNTSENCEIEMIELIELKSVEPNKNANCEADIDVEKEIEELLKKSSSKAEAIQDSPIDAELSEKDLNLTEELNATTIETESPGPDLFQDIDQLMIEGVQNEII